MHIESMVSRHRPHVCVAGASCVAHATLCAASESRASLLGVVSRPEAQEKGSIPAWGERGLRCVFRK